MQPVRPLAVAFVLSAPWVTWAAPPGYDHIVLVIEENHGYSDVIGNAAAPFINSLAGEGAVFPNFYAFPHVSAPNYGELFSGDANGINDSNPPPAVLTSPNLGAALRAAGHSFAGYSEDLPAAGSTIWSSGGYVRRHNPWVNWQDDSANPAPNTLPSSTNLPMSSFPSDFSKLPAVSIVVPSLAHDMHDGSDPGRITVADTWIKDNLGAYYTWARTHNSLLIITADEDSQKSGNYNRIPTLFAGANVQHTTSTSSWTLHNLLRTIGDVYGAAPAGAAQYTRPIAGVFSTDPPATVVSLQNGVGGYGGAHDTYVRRDQAGTAFGSATALSVDDDATQTSHALVRFDGLSASVPPGATILSAKLVLRTSGVTTGKVAVHQMLSAWSETTTWSALSGGISPDGVEASATPSFAGTPQVPDHPYFFDVSDSVQAFSDGAANNGWALLPTSADGYQFASSESATVAARPALEVTYTVAPRFKPAQDGKWASSGDWYNGVPDAAGARAHFPAGRTGRVFVDGKRTVGQLTFEKGNSHNLVGGLDPALVFDSGAPVPAQLNALGGDHTIAIPVVIQSNAEVYAPHSRITLSDRITWGSGQRLTVRSGTLALSTAAAALVNPGAQLQIDPGAAVVVDGAADPFSGGGNRVAVLNRSQAGLAIQSGDAAMATLDGEGNTTLGGTASLTVDHIRQNGLTLTDSATLRIRPDGGLIGLSALNALTISGAGTLDLGDNDLVVFYTGSSPEAQIQQYIRDGLASGHGLITSLGHDPASQSGRVLAAFDNHDAHFSSIDGLELPDFNQVIVKYTYLGDANADGKVDPTDYAIVDGLQGLGHSWITGDLNFDGKTTPDDYAQIDGNQGAGYGGAGGPQLSVSVVPEPAAVASLLPLVTLLRRRRFR